MSEERVLGDLLDVRLARFVLIHDVWVGYGPDSPVAAVYELSRAPRGGLTGKGHLSTAVADERLVDIAISAKLAARFLDAIAGARVVQGMYKPVQDHTDDYPQIEIAIQVGARHVGQSSGIALLFTESQGEFHEPWGLCIGGRAFTIPDSEIGRALAALRQPLKRATLDRMMT